MSGDSSPSSSPPEGYKTFLVNAKRHQKLCEEHLARVLAEGLHWNQPSLIDQAVLNRAAAHALLAINHGGVDLVFNHEGEFRYVVT